MSTSVRWPWIAPILVYAVSALEMIIMISPFAGYFYSVYTPLFHGLQQSDATAWLPQFFLPHLAQTSFPLFRALTFLGLLLAAVGLIGFVVCAVQLYYGKFISKRLVSAGLYGRVRHPQYLCLAVAGAGLLLLWPRFFILVTYLMMLGLYYVLARHEEEAIRARYGTATDEYLASVPMMNPFRGRRSSREWQPPARGKALLAWVAVVVISIGLAFALRAMAVNKLYAVQSASGNVTALSFAAAPQDRIRETMEAALATGPMQAFLGDKPGASLLLQITTGRSQLMHLLVDLGMKGTAREALEVAEEGEFIIVSRVVPRHSGAQDRPDPFSFSTRIEPVFLVAPADGWGEAAARAFWPDQFYPDFARLRF